ncbi:MAG: AAA family ATPase [Streptosporangiaceae bacterium]
MDPVALMPRMGPRSDLVGREAELAIIQRFIFETAAEGGALVMAGEAGIGKTAVIQAAAEIAMNAGIRVVSGAGVELESNISYAGLQPGQAAKLQHPSHPGHPGGRSPARFAARPSGLRPPG